MSKIKGVYINYYKSDFYTYIELDKPMDSDNFMGVLEHAVVKALKNDIKIDFIPVDEAYNDYVEELEYIKDETLELDEFLEHNDYGVYLDLSEYGMDNGYLGISNLRVIYEGEVSNA